MSNLGKRLGKRLRKGRRKEPLFSNFLTPLIPQIVYVSKPEGVTICDRSIVSEILFKRR